MWIKSTDDNNQVYDPILINIETGAIIFAKYDGGSKVFPDMEDHSLYYRLPSMDEPIILKRTLANSLPYDENNNYVPLSLDIDKIYEALGKWENTLEL